MQIIWVVLAVSLLWIVILTVFFFNLYNHYNLLLKGSSKQTLQGLLESLLKDKDLAKKDIEMLQQRCATIEKESLLHIQKVGLLRFNPFHDTGGDQSFILVLVDAQDSGVVISGLYSRSGTRWYAKHIVKGKGIDYELSEEEKKALKKANKIQA